MKKTTIERLVMAVLTLGLLAATVATEAATIWTGPSITFTRPTNVDGTQAVNQDRMTPQVWIARDTNHGLYNAETELGYSATSPADTEWAFGTTADIASLTFKTWVDWHGKCPPCALGQNAVLHLISEDIYIDIMMTGWVSQGGGGFSYQRSTPGAVTPPPTPTPVIEFYNASQDHYFITWLPDEIAKLDAGDVIKGWTRTGLSFQTYTTPQPGTSPVCRYYIPPALGDSHFFGRGTAECDATGLNNPSFILEDPAFMQMYLPVLGVCPANTTQVYRVFDNRPDANHRYMTDKAVRDQMVAMGWLAEGDGPDLVVMCAPQ